MKSRPVVSLVAAVAVGSLALVGCSSQADGGSESAAASQTAASDQPTREAARVTDCGGSDRGASATVSVANRTNAALFLRAVEVDCYDWYTTKNPTQFQDTFAPAGTDIGPFTLSMREIPEWGGQIRPWNFEVVGRAGSGPSLTGTMAARPTYKFAQSRCYTANEGMTACSGESLCTDDPDLEQVKTTVAMRDRDGNVVTTLKVTTACTISDGSAVIAFKGDLPTS